MIIVLFTTAVTGSYVQDKCLTQRMYMPDVSYANKIHLTQSCWAFRTTTRQLA